jgi:hypothetical protein
MISGQAQAQRQLVEETLAGLRFVRNQIGGKADIGEFIEPGEAGPGTGDGCIAGWGWKPVPEPALASLPRRGQMWEMTRYQAYQARLAAHTIGEVFGPAAAFLKLAAAYAPSITGAGVHAGR